MKKLTNIEIGKYIFGIALVTLVLTGAFLGARNLYRFYVYKHSDYNEWSATLGNKFETDFATNFPKKWDFINFNGYMHLLLRQREMNGIIKLKNNFLVDNPSRCDKKTIEHNAENISKLNIILKQRHIPLLYVVTPYTVGKYDNQLPPGIEDSRNHDLDQLAQKLRDYNVDVLDLREELHKDGIDHYSMMYRTDHHWNTEMGFYAYNKISRYINNKTGVVTDSDVGDKSKYSITNYPSWHLGSRGQRVGEYFSPADDFHLYIPNFMTLITNGKKIGNYEDIIIDKNPLKGRNAKSRYTYDTVLGKSNGHFVNQLAPNGVRILEMCDSFGKAVNPLLAIAYKELQCTNITYSLIDEYKPNVVIIIHYVGNALNGRTYDFH